MIKLYMVRHGTTDYNKKGLYNGWTNTTINLEGYEQCLILKEKLLGIKFDKIITSTLDRTIKSSEIITDNKTELIILEELKEINFGIWEGMNYRDIEKQYPLEWDNWQRQWISYRIPQGESFESFYARVERCFESLLKNCENQCILLVTHEGVMKVITTLLLNMKKEDFWHFSFDFGCYSYYEIYEDFCTIKKINC